MFLLIFLAITISSLLSLIGAFLLSRGGKWNESFSLHMTAFAAGVLLTTSLLHLAPEAIEEGVSPESIFQIIFLGIIVFFTLERMVWWFHHHHEHHGVRPSAWLIMIGDSIHNFMDGAAITASFLINPQMGLITTIAVGFHEIPQEIADFVTMIRGGIKPKKALLFNIVSSLMALFGGIATYLFHESIEQYLPLVLGFSAGMFLYIALSDLIPELHGNTHSNRQRWVQLGWLFLGIVITIVVTSLTEGFVHVE